MEQSESNAKHGYKVIDRDMIKYIAAVPMTIGHLSGYLMEKGIVTGSPLWVILSAIALFAPPVFFFSAADGYMFTRSKKRYAVRLLIFAVITQIPFALLHHGTLFTWEAISELNIFFTLLAGLCAIMIWESRANTAVRVAGVVLVDALTVIFSCEWLIFGVPIILGMHIFGNDPKKRFIWFAAAALAVQYISWGMNVGILLSPGFIAGTISMFAGYFFRTVFYNGKKGSHPVFSKWFFYCFYPLHLFLIYFLVNIIIA